MDFCTIEKEMTLGSQNWQNYISNVCVYILYSGEICVHCTVQGIMPPIPIYIPTHCAHRRRCATFLVRISVWKIVNFFLISGSTKLINVAMKPHPSKDLAYVWTITSRGKKHAFKNVWLLFHPIYYWLFLKCFSHLIQGIMMKKQRQK